MPLTKSAKKALRGSKNKALFNLRRKTKMVKAEKSVKKAVAGKAADAAATLSAAFQAIDKAMKRGVIKKNTAARKKSQLAKMVAKK